jgi:hypothetical protein
MIQPCPFRPRRTCKFSSLGIQCGRAPCHHHITLQCLASCPCKTLVCLALGIGYMWGGDWRPSLLLRFLWQFGPPCFWTLIFNKTFSSYGIYWNDLNNKACESRGGEVKVKSHCIKIDSFFFILKIKKKVNYSLNFQLRIMLSVFPLLNWYISACYNACRLCKDKEWYSCSALRQHSELRAWLLLIIGVPVIRTCN